MFELANAKDVVWEYIKYWGLCEEAQMKMFELPNARDITRKYAQRYPVSEAYKAKLEQFL